LRDIVILNEAKAKLAKRKVLVIRLMNVERASFTLRFANVNRSVGKPIYEMSRFKTEIKRDPPCLFEVRDLPK